MLRNHDGRILYMGTKRSQRTCRTGNRLCALVGCAGVFPGGSGYLTEVRYAPTRRRARPTLARPAPRRRPSTKLAGRRVIDRAPVDSPAGWPARLARKPKQKKRGPIAATKKPSRHSLQGAYRALCVVFSVAHEEMFALGARASPSAPGLMGGREVSKAKRGVAREWIALNKMRRGPKTRSARLGAIETGNKEASIDEEGSYDEWDDAVCMPLQDLERLTDVDGEGYTYGMPTRRLPKRIVLVRHGESTGNLDESEYTRTPDSQIPLTQNGHVQATQTGAMLRDLFDANDDPEYKCFFYISPYRRSKQTALGIAQAFEKRHISGVREEPQLREQDFGNFQDLKQKKAEKRERQYFGRFFYRFPNGESGADVFDRITIFEDHMVRDIDAGRFNKDTNMILCTHGLTLRLFLMRWFHWTVAEYERVANPANSTPIILERIDDPTVDHGRFHTKELYKLSAESIAGLPGCSDKMTRMVLPEKNWERALTLSSEEIKWGMDVLAEAEAKNTDGCAFSPEGPVKAEHNTC